MKIEYNPNKILQNIGNRNLSFEIVKQFEWETAIVMEDNRFDYGETRYCALGYIELRIYHLVFTYRNDTVRIISLRKANNREMTKYANT